MRRILPALALAALGCGESSLGIRVIFPDAASRAASGRLLLYAIDPGAASLAGGAAGTLRCSDVAGKTAAGLGPALLASTAIQLLPPGKDPPAFPDVPMRRLLLSALVYDLSEQLFLQACAPVEASPGESLEVTLRLTCAPGRTPCIDADGDGAPSNLDCDDDDPCRSKQLKEAENVCGAGELPALPKACLERLAREGKSVPAAPYCGDGIDEDCSGADTTCSTDADCDRFPPPLDCDDQDAAVNPGAKESCDGRDNNCNGTIDEGCSPCDVDGDGHAAPGASDPACTLPKDDPDDYDAGVHPGTTSDSGGAEGGTAAAALRGFCASTPTKNGLPARELDHDGDGKAAKDDGCPATSCDADGDGFQNASCSPPKAQEDCDDQDPRVFPGAPERCGDGVAQGCVADLPCACDGDGDGYCPPADCDDTNPKRRPWATETCNQVDDDCDGLIDEGNPDASGALLPTSKPLCNDDNDGECGGSCTPGSAGCSSTGKKLSGVCVCSAVTPTALRDEANRVKCAGESLSTVSPRCFGAKQPGQELCNGKDDNCNALLTDDGKDQCSATQGCCLSAGVGSCKDLSSDMANCGSCGKACDPARSDRCTAKVCMCGSGAACTGNLTCSGGSCVCAGCLYLGSCVAGTSVSQCGKGGETCRNCNSTYGTCQSQACVCSGGCRNPATGTCVAGTTSSLCGKGGQDCVACSSGMSCSSGTCTCPGCMAGSSCVGGTSSTQCGKAGVACQDCVALAGPCRTGSCSSFSQTCQFANKSNGTTCDDGQWCTVGDSCQSGSCATSPRDCSSVADACNDASCNETLDLCEKQPKANGTACQLSSLSGTCLGGSCCTGCVLGTGCDLGTANDACGKGGVACVNCTTQGKTCDSSGVCQ
jgi:hypothetical protein